MSLRKRWIYTQAGRPLPEPIEVEVEGPVRMSKDSEPTETPAPSKPKAEGDWVEYDGE